MLGARDMFEMTTVHAGYFGGRDWSNNFDSDFAAFSDLESKNDSSSCDGGLLKSSSES